MTTNHPGSACGAAISALLPTYPREADMSECVNCGGHNDSGGWDFCLRCEAQLRDERDQEEQAELIAEAESMGLSTASLLEACRPLIKSLLDEAERTKQSAFGEEPFSDEIKVSWHVEPTSRGYALSWSESMFGIGGGANLSSERKLFPQSVY